MFARAACVALQKLVPSKHNNSGSSSSLSTTEQLRQSGLDKATLSTILSKLETLLLDVPAFVEQEPAAEGSDNECEEQEGLTQALRDKDTPCKSLDNPDNPDDPEEAELKRRRYNPK